MTWPAPVFQVFWKLFMMNRLKFKSVFSDNSPAETISVQFMNKSFTLVYSAAWQFVNPLEFSISMHKYDPNIILKVDKENRIKQVREKIFSLSFIYWEKLFSVTYLCVAKVCESLLSVSGVTPFCCSNWR